MAYGMGFSSRGEDPDYRRESVYKFGNALSQVAAELQGQQDRKQLLAMSEVQRFFREASEDPTLANTWGADLARRFGPGSASPIPEVPYLVQALQNRAQQTAEIKSSYQKYTAGVDAAKQHIADLQTSHDTMPDTYTVPSLFPETQGLPASIPNTDKQALAETLRGAQAIGPHRTSMNSLPAQDEMNTRLYLAANKLPAPPEAMGLSAKDIKGGEVGMLQVLAAMKGLPDVSQLNPNDPEVQQIYKFTMSGAERDKLATTLQNNRSFEDYKQVNRLNLASVHNTYARGLSVLSHSLTAGQEAINNRNRIAILTQEGKMMGVGDPGQVATSAANANIKDWQQRFHDLATTGGITSADQKVALLSQRPQPLPPGAADAIADSVSAEVAMGILPAAQQAGEAAQRALDVQRVMMPRSMQGVPQPGGPTDAERKRGVSSGSPVTTSPAGVKASAPSAGAFGTSQPMSTAAALQVAIAAGHRRLMPQILAGTPDPQGTAQQRLMQNPDYAAAIANGASPYQARAVLMNKVYDKNFVASGDPMVALSAATGRPIPPAAVRTKTRAALRATMAGGGALPMGSLANSQSLATPEPAPTVTPTADDIPEE